MAKFSFMRSSDYTPSEGEVNNLPSMTVPDMVLSLQELISKHTQGVPVPTFQGYYENDQESDDDFDVMPDLNRMDMTEIEEMRDLVNANVDALKADVEDYKRRLAESEKASAESAPPREASPTKEDAQRSAAE